MIGVDFLIPFPSQEAVLYIELLVSADLALLIWAGPRDLQRDVRKRSVTPWCWPHGWLNWWKIPLLLSRPSFLIQE